MALYVDVQQIKNSPIYEYQTLTPTFILDTTSEFNVSVSADKIGIVVQNVLTSDKHVVHRYAASEGVVAYSRNKDIYVVEDINQVNVARKYGEFVKIKSKSEQKPNFVLNTPIAMLQQKQVAIQPEKAGRLSLFQDKNELKISLYILQDISQLQQHQRKQPYMTISIGNTQFLSMIRQIDHQIASKKHQKISFNNVIENKNGVERMHQSVEGKEYSVWSMRLDSMQNSRMNTKIQKYKTYECIISIIIKLKNKSSKLQLKLRVQRQQIKECAGQISQQLAKFMKFSKKTQSKQYNHNQNQQLRRSLYKVSRMENALSKSHYISNSNGENQQQYHGLRLDFSQFRVGSQASRYLASRKRKGKSQIKPVERKSSGWLCCGNGDQDVDEGAEISVDFNGFGSKVSERGRKGLSLSRKNVQLFVGPCQTKNLFSFLDPGTINKQKFHYLQPNCI